MQQSTKLRHTTFLLAGGVVVLLYIILTSIICWYIGQHNMLLGFETAFVCMGGLFLFLGFWMVLLFTLSR